LNHYARLAAMTALMFVAMFVLMYAMVDSLDNVYRNLNQFYMAGLMTAPMILIELALMWSMYQDRRANTAIAVVSLIAFAVFWLGIRQQLAIADEQFLKSMIPHHAGAILMCGQAPVQDEETKSLCQNIINSQQSEIDQMKAILSRLDHP
jgi:uncharacterized protein (DUF305 family)